MKCISNAFSKSDVAIMDGVESDELHLLDIGLAVGGKVSLVGKYVDNLSYEVQYCGCLV